jgi:hypothetical protein
LPAPWNPRSARSSSARTSARAWIACAAASPSRARLRRKAQAAEMLDPRAVRAYVDQGEESLKIERKPPR